VAGERVSRRTRTLYKNLAKGVQSTKESLDLEKSHKGWFYKYATVFVAFAVLTNLMLIGWSQLDFDISLAVFGHCAALCLVASMLLTLKDANDQEQLSVKTFVQMNFMLAAWAFVGTYALVKHTHTFDVWCLCIFTNVCQLTHVMTTIHDPICTY
jgi:hypothetical protein